jgi:hypothetical protein
MFPSFFLKKKIVVTWCNKPRSTTQYFLSYYYYYYYYFLLTNLKKFQYQSIALTHHPKILQVDTCTAYHAGSKLYVEVDVVMAPDTPLIESHDISEDLQV